MSREQPKQCYYKFFYSLNSLNKFRLHCKNNSETIKYFQTINISLQPNSNIKPSWLVQYYS